MSQQTETAFPKLDRVIKNQRRMARVNGLATALFVVCGAAGVSTLSGCASDDVEDDAAALSRQQVEATVEDFGSPSPRHGRLAEFRAEALRAMPDADIAIADIVATPGRAVTIIDLAGTLRADFMGQRATNAYAALRVELVTTHAEDGEIISYRAQLTRAARASLARIAAE